MSFGHPTSPLSGSAPGLISARDFGTFGPSNHTTGVPSDRNSQGSLFPNSRATQGAPLPKPESKDLQWNQKYHTRLDDVVSKLNPDIREFTKKLLYECVSPGTSQPDLKLVCGLLNGALEKSFDMANKADTPGYARHSAVWIFIAFCTPVFSLTMRIYLRIQIG